MATRLHKPDPVKRMLRKNRYTLLASLAFVLAGCSPERVATTPQPGGDSPAAEQPPAKAAAETRRDTVLPAGTLLRVRVNETIDSKRSRAGDEFTGVLASDVRVGETAVLPRGASVRGFVLNSGSSGRLKGRASLTVGLRSIEWNDTRVEVETDSVSRISAGHKKRNLAWIGGGSGLGALIGGIAGGGKGALIGAGAGAAAGTAGAAATGQQNVRIPAESILAFRLREPVTL